MYCFATSAGLSAATGLVLFRSTGVQKPVTTEMVSLDRSSASESDLT